MQEELGGWAFALASFQASSLSAFPRFAVVTLQSGQGARSLSLRLGQDPPPLCGGWALALASFQASSQSAFPRFLSHVFAPVEVP